MHYTKEVTVRGRSRLRMEKGLDLSNPRQNSLGAYQPHTHLTQPGAHPAFAGGAAYG